MKHTYGLGIAPRQGNHGESETLLIPRRAQIARNQRRNVPQPSTSNNESSEDEHGQSDDNCNRSALTGGKMGVKKRAKLEARAEKRQQREAEAIAREVKLVNEQIILLHSLSLYPWKNRTFFKWV